MKKIYYCFIVTFFIISSAPFWSLIFYEDHALNSENRNKIYFPKLSFSHPRAFIDGLNSYISDHHAFRSELSNIYMSATLQFLNESPIPNDVVLGKNGWYYLGNNNNYVYNEALGIKLIDTTALKRSCDNIQKMKQYCDSIGIGFYFAIAPNKENVYSEYLPLNPNKRAHFKDLMIKRAKEKYNLKIIDMGEYIYPKKDSTILYLRTDSHWNNYGGLLGAQKLIDEISKNYYLNELSENELSITKIYKREDGDLTSLLKAHVFDDDFEIKFKRPIYMEEVEIKATKDNPNITHITNYESVFQTTALVYRDSYFTAVKEPFSSCLHQTTLIWSSHFDKELIRQEIQKMEKKPDFLLFQIVERHLSIFSFK